MAIAREALRAQASALRAQADALEALAETVPDSTADELIGVEECASRYRVGRDALRGAAQRGELEVSRGPRNRLLVQRGALEAWLRSRPFEGATPQSDDDEWSPDGRRVQ